MVKSVPKRGEILVVDDQPANLETLTAILTEHGHRVRPAANGHSAVKAAQESPPDLILLDILMPNVDGYEVCERLKADERTRDIPIVFISGLGDTQEKVKAFAAGGVDYVTKPFHVEEVLARVETHLALRTMRSQLEEKNAQLGQEITERLRTEQRLRQERDKAQLYLDVAGVIIVAIDVDQNVTLINRTGCKVLGCSENAILGKNWFDTFIPEGIRNQVRTAFTELMAGGLEDVGYFENPVLSGDGQTRLIAWHNTVLKNQAGQIIGTLSSGADITKRKHAEEALQRYAAELEQRNEELDAFAHTVAHDLHNPLSVIVGFADTLQEDFAAIPRERFNEYLETIARNGRTMSNIIDELLLLAGVRLMEVEMDPIDMVWVAAEAQQRLAYMVQQYRANVILPPEESWPVAVGYAPWVEEVWVNYISNAIKYGGSPPRVELGGTEQADGMMRFWVRDNGRGLTLEEQERLFIPFTRLDRVRAKGHGLGLSVVRRIVERLGGQVGVESATGQGSVFYFTLPGTASSGLTTPL
jgi:PAS domain S-box-containing protein